MRALLMVALLAATALAGCSDDPAPADDDEPAFEDLDLQSTDTTGIIRGVVIDDAIVPVEGVTVHLVGQDKQATTTADGLFGFDNLDEGTYFLEMTKPGYAKVQQSADVVAGVADPAIVKVLMQRLPGTEPYMNQVQFTGYVGCSVAMWVVERNLCSAAGDPDRGQVIDFGDAKMPDTLQTELVWDYTQVIGERLTIIEYAITEQGAQRIGNVWGLSPQICRVGPEAPCDNGDGTGGGGTGLNETNFDGRVEMRVFASCFNGCIPGTAVGPGLVLQQEYDQIGTAFYNFQPTEGWTFINDGAHPLP